MDEQNILTKVPDNLKKLVRCTVRAFYQPIQVVCLDILTKYPCVSLTDLVEVLQMHGSQKQLQQALTSLKKDMLVKCLQKVQKIENAEKQTQKVVYFYYINYKDFVNVVKYKLDQVRKKLETKEKMSQNRASYKCSSIGCSRTYTDLEVDMLFNPTEPIPTLRCTYCHSPLEEEEQETDEVDSRTLIAQLNEYVKPIMDLLRETENLNLAPELLEPEAQSIEKYLLASGIGRKSSASSKDPNWTIHSTTDIYGHSTAVSVNIGDSNQKISKGAPKERPEWMAKSTVHQLSEPVPGPETELVPPELSQDRHKRNDVAETDTDRQILKDLMEYEMRQSSSAATALPSSSSMLHPYQEDIAARYSGSSSSGEEDTRAEGTVGASSVSWMGTGGMGGGVDEEEEESSEDDEYTIRVGDTIVPIDEVTDDMVVRMTKEEKDRYTEVYQMAFSQHDDF